MLAHDVSAKLIVKWLVIFLLKVKKKCKASTKLVLLTIINKIIK